MNQQEQIEANQVLQLAESTYLLTNGWVSVNNQNRFWYPSQRIGDIYPNEDSAVCTETAIRAQRDLFFVLFSTPV